jgi:hypothetical protein
MTGQRLLTFKVALLDNLAEIIFPHVEILHQRAYESTKFYARSYARAFTRITRLREHLARVELSLELP